MQNITNEKYYELDFDEKLKKGNKYPTEWFFTNLILKSRIELGYPSNEDFFDEDVNVYLANLLRKFVSSSLPDFYGDLDVYEKMFSKNDPRLQYELSKMYADFMFTKAALFPNFNEDASAHTYKCSSWYGAAASLGRQVAIPKALILILRKLADSTEKYLFIVDTARKEYLNIRVYFSDSHINTLINQGKDDYES